VARPRKVLVSLRVAEVMLGELDTLAADATAASGQKVTRSDVARQLLADGIRRARAAARYAARYAGEPPSTGSAA
jgi:hypothetical protein